VRNLPDGAVEMLVQGIPGDVNGCIEDIKADFAGCVRQTIIVEMPLDPRYKDFRITL
jgi:acylphosphatase